MSAKSILAAALLLSFSLALAGCGGGGGSTSSGTTPATPPTTPPATSSSLTITSATVTTTPATPLGTVPYFATGDSVTVAWTVDFVSPIDFYTIDVKIGDAVGPPFDTFHGYNNPLKVQTIYTTSGGTQGGATSGKSGSVVITRSLDRAFTSPMGTVVFGDIAQNIPYYLSNTKSIYVEARTSDTDSATGLQRVTIRQIPVVFTPNGM